MGWFNDAIHSIEKTGQDAIDSTKSELNKAGKNIKQTAQEAAASIKAETNKAIANVEKSSKDAAASVKAGLKKGVSLVDAGKGVHALNVVAMAPVRAAFISILGLNIVGIASALEIVKKAGGKHWADIQQKWWMLGGEKAKLNSFVDKGKNKKHLFENLLPKSYFDAYSNAVGPNVANQVGAAAAGLTAITGVLAALPEPTGATKAAAIYTGSGAAVFGAMAPVLKSFVKDNGGDANQVPTTIPDPLAGTGLLNPDGTPITTETGGIPKWVYWTGGTVLALGLIAGILAAAGVFKSKK